MPKNNTDYTFRGNHHLEYDDYLWSVYKECPMCQQSSFYKSGYTETEKQATIELELNILEAENLNPTILTKIVTLVEMDISPSKKIKHLNGILKEEGYLK